MRFCTRYSLVTQFSSNPEKLTYLWFSRTPNSIILNQNNNLQFFAQFFEYVITKNLQILWFSTNNIKISEKMVFKKTVRRSIFYKNDLTKINKNRS